MTATTPDIIIVGSGMAGVSAAFPLVKAGLKVLMIDYGNESQSVLPQGSSYEDLRCNNPEDLFGDFESDVEELPSSPKLRAFTNRYVFADYRENYAIKTKNFVVAGSLAKGGLSNAWGAGVSCFDDNDLQNFPLNFSDLKNSYQEIAARIGISGSKNDDLAEFFGADLELQNPTELHPNLKKLHQRYYSNSKAATSRGIKLGRSRIAVLTVKKNGRQPCDYSGLTLWGCANDSIYSARFDLCELQKFSNFTYVANAFVERVEQGKVHARIGTEIKIFAGQKIILAAGTIGSTKLVLEMLKIYDEELRLLSSPALGFAMIMPEKIGAKLNSKTLSTAQLSLVVKSDFSDVFCNLFPADAIPASEFITHVPFSYAMSRQLVKILQPAMLLGNCFLNSSYSQNAIKLLTNGSLSISGNYASQIDEVVKNVKNRIVATMWRYGIFLLPGGFKLTKPGEDIHYAGTLPMRKNPTKKYELNVDGELAGAPGIYVVDGAALSDLPAKAHSFTIMANADRIANGLLKRL